MALLRALLVDRDSMVLARVGAELERLGYAVETLGSTIGLTPELISLSVPSLVLFDAELPGLDRTALLVLVRSLQARRASRIVISTTSPIEPVQEQLAADAVIERRALTSTGAAALGLTVNAVARLDVRALIDEVLGARPVAVAQRIDVQIDMFSKSNFYVGGQGSVGGVFLATAVLQPVGQKVELTVDLNGRTQLNLAGEVAWQRSHLSFGGRVSTGVGIKLTSPSVGDLQVIGRFLEAREPVTWTG